MSRFGTVNGGAANTKSFVVQAATPDALIALASAAGAATFGVLTNPVVTSISLTGAGDGNMFFLAVEGAAGANAQGGLDATSLTTAFLLGSDAATLTKQLQALQGTSPIVDLQIAGSSQGQRVMGLVVFGTLLGGGGCSCVTWRPDGLGDAVTFDDVMKVVTAAKGPTTIYMPQPSPASAIVYLIGTGSISPAQVFDMKGSRFVSPNGPHDNLICQIRQSATLHNLAGIRGGLRLQSSKVAGAPAALTFASETPLASMNFVVEDGAELRNEGGADVMILVPPTSVMTEFYLIFNQLGTAFASGAFPAVGAGPNSILNVTVLSGGLSLDTIQPRNWIGSDPSAVVNWIHDGTMAFPSPVTDGQFWDNTGAGYHPNNLGQQVNQPTGCVGGMGPTANRPRFQGNTQPGFGCMYFDTTLSGPDVPGKPIWYNGNSTIVLSPGWVDATGTAV